MRTSFVVLVCGGRDYGDMETIARIMDMLLARYGDSLEVVHGAARGADLSVQAWCLDREVTYHGYPAKWKKLGRAAGMERNRRMAEASTPDACVAFPGGVGTEAMVKLLKSKGIPVWEISPSGKGEGNDNG
jgi:predicted Rossmann-fold nucleotide-binding protein